MPHITTHIRAYRVTEKHSTNTWLNQDTKRIDAYLDSADVIIVEKNRCIEILMDMFRYNFSITNNLNMLDLGCGDGIITKMIADKYPDNSFSLIDGSAHMLSKASENLAGANVSIRLQSFEDYVDSPLDENRYDFVYSANAIHHLDKPAKSRLYTRIYHEMKPGGLFVNMDVVKPASTKSEEWQFKMWTDWMNEKLNEKRYGGDTGKYDHIPAMYKTNEENKPSTLLEQLTLISGAGFRDVDCYYKYGIFSIIGGTKKT